MTDKMRNEKRRLTIVDEITFSFFWVVVTAMKMMTKEMINEVRPRRLKRTVGDWIIEERM